MNVVELYRLTKWVPKELEQGGIIQKYEELFAALHQNAGHPNTAFAEQKEGLISAIGNINLTELTKDQVAFLGELGISSALGKQGVAQIEDILFRNGLDMMTAIENFQEIINGLHNGIHKINLLSEALNECIHDDPEHNKDEALIRVSFLGNASISNVKKFKDWGEKWHTIGRGIAMVHDATPEDIKIIGAAKGSVILELLTNPEIAGTALGIIFGVLKIGEKILQIEKLAVETKKAKLDNEILKEIHTTFKNAIAKEKKDGVADLIATQKKELGLNEKTDGEKINVLEMAIKDLAKFIDAGGEVDFVLPEHTQDSDSATDNKFAKMRHTVTQARELINEIKAIEDHSKTSKNEEQQEG